MTVSVFGAGAFGTALAIALAREDRPVTIWGRDPYAVSRIRDHRSSPRLPGIRIPTRVTATANLDRALEAETLLITVPAQSLHQLLDRIGNRAGHARVVLCCKGIDMESGLGVSSLWAKARPGGTPPAVLTGPSFANDIAQGLPTALTLACSSEETGQALQKGLSTSVLRLYTTTDTIGAELGGAMKNVMAIACGACIGAGLGDSARAALMTRGFAEMTRLATHMGARAETMAGLSGLGDLVLTCTSEQSRNFRFGLSLGRGEDFDPSVTVEGAATARAAARVARENGLPLPITAAVAELTTGDLTVRDAMDQLLSRPLKEE
ncbi:NAD(P)H-dependent glycerol-3-phosphate dehydrogenase [Sagittula salina]|uniref:Glycerol-3-phosphate dehydrogenase [NAD(P)+] n=1 Tax=Sagittula salina TaxID=2820268 RepID=A0A940MR05_9RHOB|nr:NAD(P)H-dependent glycerol-3-phosphate dehydrogenase [Sagittula salina]MBP0484303.1 NAD(P)-dependent glycerol-3-phosphate dehydrogenase [Sagittula salina]